MSLNWNVSNVRNSETVCFIGKDDERELREVTRSLIFLTMPVGINEITARNADEFIWRLEVIKMLDAAEYGEPSRHSSWPGSDDVRAHIGLNTNASRVSEAKFLANWAKSLKRIAMRRANG